jgi:prepilin-type N-terminal cleavage/methylation domain-containing protein/prepilin-type processing-associated H-X9-DG protein
VRATAKAANCPSARVESAMKSHRTRAARAFTLVELLVVISIIGILMSLMLPAVQAVRASARRVSCSNNLHQIGLGMQSYHAAKGRFPPGGIEPFFKKSNGRQYAWSALLLPYLEQEPLYGAIDFGKPFHDPVNASAAATPVAIYLCPSASRPDPSATRAAISYGGLYGEAIPSLPRDASWTAENGTMIYDRAFSMADIRDGASNTLIVSEDSDWQDGQWINGLNIFDQKYPINHVPANPRLKENEMRSKHRGGVNGVFCDGAVHFMSDETDLSTLRAIITRAGGEPVPIDF